MKNNIVTISCAFSVLLSAAIPTRAQGTFQNLGFESANIPNGTPPGPIATSNALPGWNVFYGSNQISQTFYNDVSTGATQATLVGANDPFGPNAIEGNFGVLLQGGSTLPYAAITQTGLVPGSAESILFKADSMGPMVLSLGGQDISYFAIGSGLNYTLYGGNIPISLAGQVEELEFSVPEGPGGNNAWNIDSVVFSSSPLPEPGTLAVLGAGAVLFGLRRWRKR